MEVFWFVVLFIQIIFSSSLENIAFNKSATQSSNLHENKWLAGSAVDGNRNQLLSGNSCACTGLFKPTVWWKVDLGTVFAMSNVKIYYKNQDSYRLTGFKLYVNLQDNFMSSSPVYVSNNGKQEKPYLPANVTVKVSTYGQYVTLYKDRSETCTGEVANTNSNFCALFELCEVEIQGCPEKRYGTDCQKDCPINCSYDVCAISDGKCFGCKAGYKGDTCDQPCDPGKYGIGCLQSCSDNCKDGATCEVRNGACPSGCSNGYKGTHCTEICSPGTFGSSCLSICGSCKNNITCNHVSGLCANGCDLGVTGQYCKLSCDSGHYGYNCSDKCGGNCLNGVTCNVQAGYCDNGCAAGWKGHKCNIACSGGKYGLNCLNNCTGNCANQTDCNRVDGSCQYGCKSGWKGNTCNQVCASGMYGPSCSEYCGKCNNRITCDRHTGICPEGCSNGYKGLLCKDKCDPGMYGAKCSLVCVSCNNSCNHVTGECDAKFVQSPQQQPDSSPAIAAGVGATVVVITIIIVVVVLVIRMRRKSKDVKRRFSKRISALLANDADNPPGPSAVYGEVDKSNRKTENAIPGPSALYAAVDKNKKTPQPNKNAVTVKSDLYAKVDKSTKMKAKNDAKSHDHVDKPPPLLKSGISGKDGVQGSSIYEDVDTKPGIKKGKQLAKPKEPERSVNPQGLVYVDVEFPNTAHKQTRSIDKEERTEYASLQMQ